VSILFFRVRLEVLVELKINEIHPQSQVDLALLFIINKKPASGTSANIKCAKIFFVYKICLFSYHF
jgi:hypothetical protein